MFAGEENNKDTTVIPSSLVDVLMHSDMEKLPTDIIKTIKCVLSVKTKITKYKKNIDELFSEIKILENSLMKIAKKEIVKQNTISDKPRKLCGFALPYPISNELCEFMNMSNGSTVARTDVTKYLMKYIADHKLQNPENKRCIIPDESLWKLIGNDNRDIKITYFTIQKYMNKHFIKR